MSGQLHLRDRIKDDGAVLHMHMDMGIYQGDGGG
jgi:hypothetical protein